MYLIVDDMIVDISDPKNPTRNPLPLINTFSKVSGYKPASHKSVAFLHTNDKWTEERNHTHFTVASKI